MTSRQLVERLRERVPPERWALVWWLAPAAMILLLPVGALILRLLGMLGWYGAPRATQGLILISVVGGVVVGAVVLWTAPEADLETRLLNRVQWLARFSVVCPLLTLLVIAWLAQSM